MNNWQKILFLLVLVVISGYLVIQQDHASTVSPVGIRPSVQKKTATISSGLEQAVSGPLEGTNGTYGIVIKNLKTGEYYAQNEHRTFETASDTNFG